jgi:hypothetical protein
MDAGNGKEQPSEVYRSACSGVPGSAFMPEWKEKRHPGKRIAGTERVRLHAEPAVLTASDQ